MLALESLSVRYDDFQGHWGNVSDLHKFLQRYAVEKTKIEGNRRGHTVTEQQLDNGSIRLQIAEVA